MNSENFFERLSALEAKSSEPSPENRQLLAQELDAIQVEIKNSNLPPEELAAVSKRLEEISCHIKSVRENAEKPKETDQASPIAGDASKVEEDAPHPQAMLGSPAEPRAALYPPEAPAGILPSPAVPLGPPKETDTAAIQEKETKESASQAEAPPRKQISAESAADIARIEAEADQALSITAKFDIDATRPRSVFDLRNHIKELQKQIKSLPATRQLREKLRLRLQEAWIKTQEFLANYSELGKKELSEFYAKVDNITSRSETVSSFESIKETREEIKQAQQDLRTAHLKREEFQKIRRRLQEIWDKLDGVWVKLRTEAKKEVDAFTPQIDEVRIKVETASEPEELKEAGDALKATQSELKEKAFPRSDKDKLFRTLQKIWELLQEKWRDLRAGNTVEAIRFDEKLTDIQKTIESASDIEGFQKGRETIKKLQGDIQAANLPKPDRRRYFDKLQEIWEILMKKQEDWYKRENEGKD